MSILKPTAIRQELARAPEWRRRGQSIVRMFEFEDFAGALRFVNRVARAAESVGHHPDILVQWNRVTLTLSTHDAGGLTLKDFELAARVDALGLQRRGGRRG